MNPRLSKRLLQGVVLLACIVPISAGLYGIITNPDSHYDYLSGLLLGIGLAFVSCVPKIETQTQRFQLLTFIVFVGGLARLASVILHAWPTPMMQFALVMELGVTPALCFWQWRLAKAAINFMSEQRH
jgi:hypothetical protein